MKVTLLGTGSSTGTPQLLCKCDVCKSENPRNRRTRFSILLETGQRNILIDTPFESRIQLLNSEIESLDAVWLTHAHSDHYSGLDDIRMFSFKNRGPLSFFALPDTINNIETRYPYMFHSNEYIDRPILSPVIVSEKPMFFYGAKIIPLIYPHGVSTVTSFRLNNFAFLSDISTIDEKEKEKLRNLDLLIVSSTVKHDHYKHMKLDDVIALIMELKPRRAALTHMNHRFDYEEMVDYLPSPIVPGFDGLSFIL